jgi:polyhydroxyalkanoate synthesis regulator phasin
MPQGPDLTKLIEAGMTFTEMRRSQARQIVSDLVAQGQLAQDRAAAAVDEVLEISRRRREDLRMLVQSEIQRQVRALGIATRDDLARLERKIGAGTAAKPAKKASAAKKAPAKKAVAKKRAATTVARKSTATAAGRA